MKTYMRRIVTLAAVGISLFAAIGVQAVTPTDEAVAQWKSEGVWEQKVAEWQQFKANGGCSPNENLPYNRERMKERIAAGVTAVETVWVPVILVDFPDLTYDQASYSIPGGGTQVQRAVGTAGKFDTLLWSQGLNPTGSMTEFYWENSYGKIFMRGVVMGWYTMPHDYSYYVGGDDGLGGGGPLLAKDAINTADAAGNDFSVFDADGNNYIPGVILIHAGPGAEAGAYGIWSHKSSPAFGTVSPDGKLIESYTLNPEELGAGLSTVGVFCHEYGHVMGMPDLYDINEANSPENDGLGRWSLMAGGSWNGSGNNGSGPASFDAWCKYRLGFVTPMELTANIKQAAIPSSQVNPVSYWLWNTSKNMAEYWLVENRQKKGLFDSYLPGAGLCIYHFDGAASSNDNPARLKVSLEQADGLFNLEYTGGSDAGDPFPGTANKRNWNDRTVPSSRYNVTDSTSQVGVWNISNADSVMYADLDIRWSRPYIKFLSAFDSLTFSDAAGGDNDGVMEPGETVAFNCRFKNTMLLAGYGHVHLEADNPNLVWVKNDVRSSAIFNPSFDQSLQEPIRFSLPNNFQTSVVTFTMTMWVDSSFMAVDSEYVFTYEFTKVLGKTNILLVDDDNNQSKNSLGYETRIAAALDRIRVPYDVWTKLGAGSPVTGDLTPYRNVIWITGPSDTTTGANYGGTLTTQDVAAMKGYLDNGGGLLLSSVTAAQQLTTLDISFLTNYLHCAVASYIPTDEFAQEFWGQAGTDVGNGTRYQLLGNENPFYSGPILAPVNGGVPEFIGKGELSELGGSTFGIAGVSYSGSYQTLFLTFGLDVLNDGLSGSNWQPKDTLLLRALNFFAEGQATGVDDPHGHALPSDFALAQNYPNPFNPSTTISYTITANGRPVRATLDVLNMLGQRVTALVDKVLPSGTYTVTWNGTDSRGNRVSSGTYLYRLVAGEESMTKKMVLVK